MASDNFNRADAGSLGANWTEQTNGMKVVSNQATPVNFSGARQFVYHNDSVGNDQYSKVEVATAIADPAYSSYVNVRAAGAGSAQDAYSVNWGEGFGYAASLVRIEDNSVTILQSLGTGVVAVGDVIGIDVVGTTVRALKNGSQLGTNQTDSMFATGNFGFGGGFTGYDVFDNWEGGTLGAVANRRRRFLLAAG